MLRREYRLENVNFTPVKNKNGLFIDTKICAHEETV